MVLLDLERQLANLDIADKEEKPHVTRFAEDEVQEQESLKNHYTPEVPINCFDHEYLFRAVSSGSDIRGANGEIHARLFPPPEAFDSEKDAKKCVENHLDKDLRVAGPFISLASDFLRVLNIAWGFSCNKKTGIKILAIDSWKLRNGSFASCNKVRRSVGLEADRKYNNEALAWGDAIVHEWSWECLEGSGLFMLFPALAKRGKDRSISTLPDRISSTSDSFSIENMVDVLEICLQMSPLTVLTRQI